jgi:hypothetical protein
MAGCNHLARAIDARHHRPFTHDRRFAGNGQAIFVVDRRVLNRHSDITIRGQLRIV